MYRLKHPHQLSFKDVFLSFGCKRSGDHRSINLSELIPKDELKEDYDAQFCKGFGAPAKPFRMAIGAWIIKPRLDLTGKELLDTSAELTLWLCQHTMRCDKTHATTRIQIVPNPTKRAHDGLHHGRWKSGPQ